MATYEIEYAKSSRSTCRLCQGKIAKDMLRMGSIGDPEYGERVYWRCFPECFTKRVAKNIQSTHGSIEKIKGYDNLKKEDQTFVKETFHSLVNDVEGEEKQAKDSGEGKDEEISREDNEDNEEKEKSAEKRRKKEEGTKNKKNEQSSQKRKGN